MNTLDYAIFGSFLAINLGVGLWFGKGVKSLKEYAVGNRDFSTINIIATIVASAFSGLFFMFITSKVHNKGLFYIIANCGLPLQILFMGLLTIRMGAFLNKLSVAEAMGSVYGKKVRIITALGGILRSISFIAAQFKISAMALTILFNLEGAQAAVVSAIVVTLYATFGGIRSVSFTDMVQLLAILIFLPMLASLAFKNFCCTTNLFEGLQDPRFSISKTSKRPPRFWLVFPSFSFMHFLHFAPPIFNAWPSRAIRCKQGIVL